MWAVATLGIWVDIGDRCGLGLGLGLGFGCMFSNVHKYKADNPKGKGYATL